MKKQLVFIKLAQKLPGLVQIVVKRNELPKLYTRDEIGTDWITGSTKGEWIIIYNYEKSPRYLTRYYDLEWQTRIKVAETIEKAKTKLKVEGWVLAFLCPQKTVEEIKISAGMLKTLNKINTDFYLPIITEATPASNPNDEQIVFLPDSAITETTFYLKKTKVSLDKFKNYLKQIKWIKFFQAYPGYRSKFGFRANSRLWTKYVNTLSYVANHQDISLLLDDLIKAIGILKQDPEKLKYFASGVNPYLSTQKRDKIFTELQKICKVKSEKSLYRSIQIAIQEFMKDKFTCDSTKEIYAIIREVSTLLFQETLRDILKKNKRENFSEMISKVKILFKDKELLKTVSKSFYILAADEKTRLRALKGIINIESLENVLNQVNGEKKSQAMHFVKEFIEKGYFSLSAKILDIVLPPVNDTMIRSL